MIRKEVVFFAFILCLLTGCKSNRIRTIINFRFFEKEKELDIESFKQNFLVLDKDNNKITDDKIKGIKYNDSLNYLFFNDKDDIVIRKIIKEKDTMLLYFKTEYEKKVNIFTIDSLIFKKGEYLIDQNIFSDNLPSLVFSINRAKYYNHYIDLVLEEKNKTKKYYTESAIYKTLLKLKKKRKISKYDYTKYKFILSEKAFSSSDSDLVYLESDTFLLNGRKYFWQYGYSKTDYKSSENKIFIDSQYLVDVEKEEIVLKISLYSQKERTYNYENIKKAILHSISFEDVNFDGYKDIIQYNSKEEQTAYLYKEKENRFKVFDDLLGGELVVDKINKKLIRKTHFSVRGQNVLKEKKVSFDKEGNVQFTEFYTNDIARINDKFYEIIYYSKRDDSNIHLDIIKKTIDTIEIKGDKLEVIKHRDKQYNRYR